VPKRKTRISMAVQAEERKGKKPAKSWVMRKEYLKKTLPTIWEKRENSNEKEKGGYGQSPVAKLWSRESTAAANITKKTQRG